MWRRGLITYPSRCISSSGEYADSGDGFCASLVGGAFYSRRVDSVGGGAFLNCTGVLTPWERGCISQLHWRADSLGGGRGLVYCGGGTLRHRSTYSPAH